MQSSQFFVLSLKSSTDRRERTYRTLTEAGISFEFIDGVDGRAGEHPLLKRFCYSRFLRWHGRPALPGEAGCYASHFLAWQTCVELGHPIVVFEDDFLLSEQAQQAFETAFSLADRYDFIRLEPTTPKPGVMLWQSGPFRLRRFLKVPQCATCYLITPKAAKRLIDASEVFFLPVDVFIRHTHLHGVAIHELTPPAVRRVEASAAASVIGDRHKQKAPWWSKLTRQYFRISSALRNGWMNLRFWLGSRKR